MSPADITLIERELGITLPEAYKAAVVPFRIQALAGNTEYELWDDAARLIELNRELRAGSRWRPAWPTHLFAVGDPHGDEISAVDTRSPDGPVWWLDHKLVESKASYQSHARFADWVEEFERTMRKELRDRGVDPDGSPAEEKRATARSALHDLFALLGFALLGFGVLLGYFWLRRWLRHH